MHKYLAIVLIVLIILMYRESFYPFAGLQLHNMYRSDPAFDNHDERYKGGAHEIPDNIGWQCQSDPLYHYCPARKRWVFTCDDIHKANCPGVTSVYGPVKPGYAARNHMGKLFN